MTTTYERQPTELQHKDILDAFEHAKREFPKEACGIFTHSIGYFPCTNTHPEPEFNFAMKEYMQVAANSNDVIAIFHSHTNGNEAPSAEDMRFQIATGFPWGVASLHNANQVDDCFFWGSNNIPPLRGRRYRSGANDCYSIIKDAYKLWYDIDLPEFPRDSEFWNRGQNLYSTGFQKAGFKEMPLSEIKPGDVLLGSIRGKGIINHGGVVLNDKEVIHHLALKLSRRESLSRWSRVLNIGLRHKSFGNNPPPHPPEISRQ